MLLLFIALFNSLYILALGLLSFLCNKKKIYIIYIDEVNLYIIIVGLVIIVFLWYEGYM